MAGGNLMSTKNRTRRTTTRNIRFLNIEQINIALEQKGSGIPQLRSLVWLPEMIVKESIYIN